LIRRGISLIVGVPFHAQFQIGILLQQVDDFVENLSRVSEEEWMP